MSATPIVPMSLVSEARPRPAFLLPAPKFPVLLLAALPAAVVALSSEGRAQQVSALIAIGWFSLVPIALFERWVALALPVVAAAFLALALAALPTGSAAQTVDFWSSATLFVLSLLAGPRPPRGPARRRFD